MKTEVKLTQSIGKTLEAVAFSGNYVGGKCVLVFSDGTFATLGVNRGYEAGDEEIEEIALPVFEFGDAELIRVGIVTVDELAQMRKDRDDKARSQIAEAEERRDRAEFERLKRKYEV